MHDMPVIIGAGLAGLMAALRLAPEPVLVLSRAPLGEQAASAWAQGGLAAAIGEDDSPELHLADTLAAGDGLCDAAVARRIISAAPALIDELQNLGARFDRTPRGAIALGLEAGHSRHRIVHAQGDSSGREILRAVIEAVRRTPSITLWEGAEARDLLTRNGAVAGLVVGIEGEATPRILRTSRVLMASGGSCGLYLQTTVPSLNLGQGLAIAARAGAALGDLEFVQFHPTALDAGLDPMPLISEAVRGEGAILIDETGRRFMAGQGRAELEPRDIVSRAVFAERQNGHKTFLDARACLGRRFAARFPAINAACLAAGIDPATQPIPIHPAAHYHMGGIAVDADGRSTIEGLWAAGEAACTGLHGANRLASNSLLEAAITGQIAACAIAGTPARKAAPITLLAEPAKGDTKKLRSLLSAHAGVLRDGETLSAAYNKLKDMEKTEPDATLPLMMVAAMLRREESRGAHARTDFPGKNPGSQRAALTLQEARNLGAAAGAAAARPVIAPVKQ
jgi:L-aspartate oxidase